MPTHVVAKPIINKYVFTRSIVQSLPLIFTSSSFKHNSFFPSVCFKKIRHFPFWIDPKNFTIQFPQQQNCAQIFCVLSDVKSAIFAVEVGGRSDRPNFTVFIQQNQRPKMFFNYLFSQIIPAKYIHDKINLIIVQECRNRRLLIFVDAGVELNTFQTLLVADAPCFLNALLQ